MSVFDSLFTAVSGLNAQSQALSMISNNIANSSTTGYKESEASFESLVTSQANSTLYSPGAVKAVQNQLVDLQGILQQESSATNIAVSGNGMFVVKDSTTSATAPTVFTRAGSFTQDQNGNLVNTAGYTLYGWQLDQNGNVIGSTTSLSSLVPVNVAFPGGLASPTTDAALAANLNASQVAGSAPTPNFTSSTTVFDSLGNAHVVTATFNRLASQNATATGTDDVSQQTGTFQPATDTFTIAVGAGAPQTIQVGGQTVTQVLNSLNAIAGISASLNANGQLNIESTAGATNITLADGSGTPLETDFGITPGTFAPPAAYTPMAGTTLQNPENPDGWWNVTFTSDTGTLISGDINFNGTGTLNAQANSGTLTNVGLNNINWGNGSAVQNIGFDLSKMTQLSGGYNVSSNTQNGTALGFETGVSVGKDGTVSVQFTNGLSRNVYKVPLVDFANPDGLTALDGNVYETSNNSGTPLINAAQSGGAGTIEGGELEESNVDIANEFSNMIVTQEAFSANSKVISTSDQMLASLLAIQTA